MTVSHDELLRTLRADLQQAADDAEPLADEQIEGYVDGTLDEVDREIVDTRLADDPMTFNPAAMEGLVQLALGGLHPGRRGTVLHCRLRYFDPLRRRAGLPDDVAALIEGMTDSDVTLSLVNIHQSEERTVVVQAGGYGEHQLMSSDIGGRTIPIDRSWCTVRLAPGAGARLQFRMKRHVNAPALDFPWGRE